MTVLNGTNFSSCTEPDDGPILFSFTGDPEIPLQQIVVSKIIIAKLQ